MNSLCGFCNIFLCLGVFRNEKLKNKRMFKEHTKVKRQAADCKKILRTKPPRIGIQSIRRAPTKKYIHARDG